MEGSHDAEVASKSKRIIEVGRIEVCVVIFALPAFISYPGRATNAIERTMLFAFGLLTT